MQKETLKERVYRGIYEAVTNGEYRPNDILTENQMIEKFGVNALDLSPTLAKLLLKIARRGLKHW